MSDSQQYEKVTVASDGVTVDKRFEENEFPVPAIAFEIQSSRSETVDVTIVDEVPEDVAVEDLGFHPEYGSEYWTIDEDQITFEREIEANAEYTTVYGIRATGTDNVEQFLTEPVIEEVEPPLPDDAETVVDDGASDVVRDVISGDSDSVPGLDDGDDDDVETLDLKDPNAPEDESSGGATADSGGESASGGNTGGGDLSLEAADVSSLCGALAAEIRNGDVTEDDVRLLRKAFDAVGESGGSVDARIQRLQTEVSDLMAYTDALEDFLDENGTGEELIEGFREDVQSFQSDLEEVREIAEGQEDTVNSLEETVEDVKSTVDGIESDVNGVVSDIEDVEGELESLEDEIDGLEEQIGDIDVEDVKGDIDDIEDEIEELKEWREQLSSVIGGGN